MLSVGAHVLVILAILFGPDIPWIKHMLAAQEAARREEINLARQEQRQREPQFMYVMPRSEMERPKSVSPRADMADRDRAARTVQRPPNPKNDMAYSRGNTAEMMEAQKPVEKPRGQGPAPDPAAAQRGTQGSEGKAPQTAANQVPLPQGQSANAYPTSAPSATQARPSPQQADTTPGGQLGQALKNLQKYTENQTFNNPDGGNGQFGPSIQFDTKGVEFGPWIRRFIAQVKRNWFIPDAAAFLKGHVVLQFNVHKTGAITDISVVQPSPIEAFNNAAVNAIRGSNPTIQLPPEYPTDKAFFTVTFYYNESPP
jgi:TonB family protein